MRRNRRRFNCLPIGVQRGLLEELLDRCLIITAMRSGIDVHDVNVVPRHCQPHRDLQLRRVTSRFIGMRDSPSTGRLTAIALVAIAGLHVAWGLGSSFPFRTRQELADSVVGTDEMPSLRACVTVAVLLVVAALTVARIVPLPKLLRTVALRVIASTLATRGVAGALGRTSVLSPGSDSASFTRLDKRLYAPLCLWLATGVRRAT
jgi:hypothetical protein